MSSIQGAGSVQVVGGPGAPDRDDGDAGPVGRVSGPVRRVVEAVRELAAVPVRDPYTGLLNVGVGPDAEPSLTALARARHGLDAATAKHMVAAELAGSTAHDPATVVAAGGHTAAEANRLLIAGRFAHRAAKWFPGLWDLWESGKVSTAQMRALAADTAERCNADVYDLVDLLLPRLPQLTPAQITRAVESALAVRDPDSAAAGEQDAYQRRRLTLTDTDDGVRISGVLPRLEGQALAALVDAHAEQQRAHGDRLTARQRRADGLAAVVAAAADTARPSQGGLPAAVVMTIPAADAQRLANGSTRTPPARLADTHPDTPLPGTHPGGHALGDGEARFALCCADITPIAAAEPGSLIDRLTGSSIEPLAVGRAHRLATTAQRKALALRDGGCVIDGCTVPARHCQPHHIRDWSLGGATDLDNLALLCWVHHRQVDLNRWTITRTNRHWTTTPTPRHHWLPPTRPHPHAA
jgi:hypothetical protein